MSLTSCGAFFRLSTLRNFKYYFKSNAFHSNSKIIPKLESVSQEYHIFRNARTFYTSHPSLKKARVSITFLKSDGNKVTGIGKEGESLLDVVVNNDLDLEGFGACEGTLTCSTCHIIFKTEDFNKLSEKISDEELDMMDLAPEICSTSRLGCQISVTNDMEGLVVKVPAVVRDAREFPTGDS